MFGICRLRYICGAYRVFSTDVDWDGDLDVLGAVAAAGDIARWEYTAGDSHE